MAHGQKRMEVHVESVDDPSKTSIYTADVVVVTVSIGVLKSNDIR